MKLIIPNSYTTGWEKIQAGATVFGGEMMDSANSGETNRYWISPLFSFHCDSESLDLTNGSRIIRTPEEFKEYIKATDEWQRLIGTTTIPDWLFVLPCGETMENVGYKLITSDAETLRAFNILVNFVQACRIYRQGSIFPGDLILTLPTNDRWIFGLRLKTYLQKDNRRPNFAKPVYTLKELEVPRIENWMSLLKKVANLEKHDDIHIALRRFNSSYDGEHEDRLIDQMIAFESLYLGDSQELTYKLALRAAFLIGKRKDTRKAIFSNLKEAYALRGQIVHGNKNVKLAKVEAMVPEIEDYLRKSIQRFILLLSQRHSLREIRDKLDENILSNGKLLGIEN